MTLPYGRQRDRRLIVVGLSCLTVAVCGSMPAAVLPPLPAAASTPAAGTPAAEGSRDERPRPAPLDLSGLRFAAPLVITEGGTYSGNWESANPDVPAISIRTDEPVMIRGSHLRSRGHLIEGVIDGVDLTVIDSTAEGLNPSREGRVPGRFVILRNPSRVLIERNELNGTSGIRLEGYTGNRGDDTYRILRNRVTNVDGRMSTGTGFSSNDSDAELVQFVQFVQVRAVPGIEVSWNDVCNEPGRSRVEDVVSVYVSSGTDSSPISLQDNFIKGAYPVDPTSDQYSGGGIMLGDGVADGSGVGNVDASRNVIVNTTNYGMAVSAGQSMRMSGNRLFSTGLLPNGAAVAAQNVGLYVWNIHQQPDFGDVEVFDNVAGWERPNQGDRNDFWLPDVSTATANESYNGVVTDKVIGTEYSSWLARARAAGVTIGPRV